MRCRTLLFTALIGAAALVYLTSNRSNRSPVTINTTTEADHSLDAAAAPPDDGSEEVDQLTQLLKDDPGKALAFLAKLEREQRFVPPPEYPEAARLSTEDRKIFASEVEALTSIFQRVEKESAEVVFEGPRNGAILKNVRINAPSQEQFDQMAQAYSAVLGKYPKESDLHTALWERITQLMRGYSSERLLFFSRSEDGPWNTFWEIRSTKNGRDVGEVTSGVPDENGRMKFAGPCKVSLQSADEPGGSKALSQYSHLLTP